MNKTDKTDKTVTSIKSAKGASLACGYKLDRDERDALVLLDEAMNAARELFETDKPDADMVRGVREAFADGGLDEGAIRKKLDLSVDLGRAIFGAVSAEIVFGLYFRVAAYLDDKDVRLSHDQMKAAAELARERFGEAAGWKETFAVFDAVFGDEEVDDE
jgi:hypothetical protein